MFILGFVTCMFAVSFIVIAFMGVEIVKDWWRYNKC